MLDFSYRWWNMSSNKVMCTSKKKIYIYIIVVNRGTIIYFCMPMEFNSFFLFTPNLKRKMITLSLRVLNTVVFFFQLYISNYYHREKRRKSVKTFHFLPWKNSPILSYFVAFLIESIYQLKIISFFLFNYLSNFPLSHLFCSRSDSLYVGGICTMLILRDELFDKQINRTVNMQVRNLYEQFAKHDFNHSISTPISSLDVYFIIYITHVFINLNVIISMSRSSLDILQVIQNEVK